ncbi:MAG TPA: sigma-54-dependent Fis family transcriptional regulator [Caldithrix abyssi]|uniref:Sigma-54-dependent Fis family transcriptional regulator n=1 Tax=Caldithrix abyssi TaxID=187145 RepID=A0A7V4WVJ9_CALAY|nr:sigma-54-dependent Fis family transcriptional regulator [Caldithrix abyssi]
MHQQILLVEDEENLSYFIKKSLEKEDYSVSIAHTLKAARHLIKTEFPDLLLLDLNLPDGDGLELYSELKENDYDIPCVIITAHGSIQSAIRAMKSGVDDYVVKPFDMNQLSLLVKNLMQRFKLKNQLNYYRHKAQCGKDHHFFESTVPALQEVQHLARKIAKVPTSTVLIEGPTGSGKEMYARYIHNISAQSSASFIEVNCASLSETLLESELFGYEPGAFTDAKKRKIGLIELAHGGTLFLDEITEMSTHLQAKLLRFIDNLTFKRLGGVSNIKVRVRIIAATNQDIEQLVKEQKFREDLFYRLSMFRLYIPPLSERKEELLLIAQYLIDKISKRLNKRVELSEECHDIILNYPWPGNMRELHNVLERAIILINGNLITPDHLPKDIKLAESSNNNFEAGLQNLGNRSLREYLGSIEKAILEQALKAAGGNQIKTSKLLKEPRHIIRYLVKKHRLDN